MKKIKMFLLIAVMAGIALAHDSAPVVPPGVEVPYDPNMASSPVVGAFRVYAGRTYNYILDVIEEQGEPITVTADLVTIGTISSQQVEGTTELEYKVHYSFSPTPAQRGINKAEFTVKDEFGNETKVTNFFNVVVNTAPIVHGCRAF